MTYEPTDDYDGTLDEFGRSPEAGKVRRVLTSRGGAPFGHYPDETPDAFEWASWDAANVARVVAAGGTAAEVRAALLDSGVHSEDDDERACLGGDVAEIMTALLGVPS